MTNQAFNFQNQLQQPQMMYNNYGGYPNGYPPVAPQFGYQQPVQQPMFGQGQYSPFVSPFPSPQPMTPIVPGVTVPLELENSSGAKVTIPASGYNPGGATVSQGGFNPMTGVTSAPTAQGGFNPYAQFIGNPGYMVAGQGTGFVPPMPQVPQQQGFSPYVPQPRPIMNGYYNTPMYYGYGQNQFDYQLQDLLYNEQPSIMDAKEMLAQVILSDEEREKINHRGYVVGYDYYGNPIYNNGSGAYYANQQKQNAFEEARTAYQRHFTMLSRVAHAYSGETIDEEATMRRFDPVPPQQQIPVKKIFNYNTASEEERAEYEAEARMQATSDLHMKVTQYDYNMQLLDQQKLYAFAQIKASHDRMIGVEPGQHYDLKTFLDNGYKIGVNIAMQKAKSANRNGTNKYSRNDFRGNLSQQTNTAVPITSKDDEYVSIEQMLKGVYDRNKRDDAILRSQNGQTTYTSAPAFSSEREAHKYFLQAMQEKKNTDDIRRAVM